MKFCNKFVLSYLEIIVKTGVLEYEDQTQETGPRSDSCHNHSEHSIKH